MVSVKNDQKAKVQSLLAIIADYVTVTCKGHRTMLLTSGFDVTDENGSGNPIAPLAIEKLVVELGESGEATTRITKATAAIAFVLPLYISTRRRRQAPTLFGPVKEHPRAFTSSKN
jgi:hypothetical protein